MDLNYTVLARRFRPQTFADVVGQERISQTLCNAIREGRVAHAYLFTGARGVGKTSMARIFAKALNCPAAHDAIPCNECEVCTSIAAGQDVDVSEIDGASNRGIDDIRALRANVNVKSMRSPYKVYIIDEVHMLTKEAFNALLKTLEEPPPRVKFVFCTTEPNKVPDTILSRCQRFDFGTISTANISIRLTQLATAEGRVVDPAAVTLIARRAQGSMRDSQSLFDQLLAFGADHLGVADVHRLLGTAPDDRLLELLDSLSRRDRPQTLSLLHRAVEEGVQLESLADQLLAAIRDVMVLASGALDVPLLGLGDDALPALRTIASRWGLQSSAAALQILSDTKARMQRVTHGRVLFELGLVRITLLEELDQLGDLIRALTGPGSGPGIAVGGSPTSGGSAAAGPAQTAAPSAPRVLPAGPSAVAAPTPPLASHNSTSSASAEAAPSAAAEPPLRQSLDGSAPTPRPVDSAVSQPRPPNPIPAAAAVPAISGQPAIGAEPLESPSNFQDPAESADSQRSDLQPPAATDSGTPDTGTLGITADPGKVPFQRMKEKLIVAELAKFGPVELRPALQNFASAAIIGPDRLDIQIPPDYDQACQASREPTLSAALKKLMQAITGKEVAVTLSVVPSQPVGAVAATRPGGANSEQAARQRGRPGLVPGESPGTPRSGEPVTMLASRNAAGTGSGRTDTTPNDPRRLVELPDDDFVAEVGRVLGIQVWSRQALSSLAAGVRDDSDGEASAGDEGSAGDADAGE